MDDRREDASIRTDRPTDAAADASLPTVREVLALPELVEGLPDVIVGGDALDARVRWVHVSDSAGVARLLNGGELLLSTGSGWPADPNALRTFIGDLVAAGLSGLVLELGTHYRYLPAVVAEAARERDLALVTLHREVKFVAVTEAVHNRIISEQIAALRARDEVRERFTALALRGAPADYVVHQLAQTLGAPVVLENLAHEVIAADIPPALEEELLTGWEYRSRAAHRDPGEWLVVPVEARGTRWGNLLLLPGPPHPAGRRGVLEQGAIALALGRLAEGEADEWSRLSRRRLVDGLLAGRFAGAGAAGARLEAAGLPVTGARLHGVVLSGAPIVSEAVDAAARGLRGRALTGSAPAGVPGPAAAILLSLPVGVEFDDRTARAFARAAAGDGADRSVLSVGAAAYGLDEALASLQEAIDLAAGGGWREGRGLRVRRGDDRPLVRLLTTLRDDHRLLEHGERMLAPLIDYDLARDGDLLDVLGAMLAHPGNRTAAASASHLSRSVFYQRISLIEDLLDTDLDDGETQAALHVALLVRRAARR
ncbi:PucR family transcriptional regulator [Microbacterium sp. ASV49]|uniref:PucR family transcriptional regulator ligand-binding domain-containing protein n=1 Tax=Microbacterium candidum TaxID=3041922 RepID=A0ABT7MVR7_9MICO|nr:PucR family transcriptional regulator [Microbacterium sp. ASV49]MDL9978526.1 PucR family transcriptional regulator ligand-binding domain-containing protein [Microbacterium sp. ASV49]